MTNPERTSGEKGISLKTWIIILLLLTSGGLGYDRLFGNNSGDNTGDKDRTSETTSDGNNTTSTGEQDGSNSFNADIRVGRTVHGADVNLILEALDIDSIEQMFLPENLDETPDLQGTRLDALRVQGVEDYLTRFTAFAEYSEQDLRQLFINSPVARRFFAPVVFGDLTNWSTELTPRQAISQNFADILSTEEGRTAVQQANALFANSLTTRTINGEVTTVFRNHPGSATAGFDRLWIASPEGGDGYLRSTITTQGFENAQRATYAQLIGYAQLYSEHYDLNWTQDNYTHFANRILSTYMAGGFEVVGGYDPIYYLGTDNRARALDYTLDLNVNTRRLQAGEDTTGPNYGDRADQNLEWTCMAVTNEGSLEPASFPSELDGEDSYWTVEIPAFAPEDMNRVSSPEALAQLFINGEFMNIRYWHEDDEHTLRDIPDSYENQDDNIAFSRTYAVYGICAVSPRQEVIIPTTPDEVTPPPEQPPEQPPEEPPEEEEEKSPRGNQTNPDGETEPDPTGGEVIIDGQIDTDGDGVGDTEDNIGSGR